MTAVRLTRMRERRSTMKRSVLIVEDEPIVALEIESLLARAGFAIQGCAGSIEKALALVDDRHCDAAVLDANLRGRSVGPVAAALQRRGTPFLFVSGSG